MTADLPISWPVFLFGFFATLLAALAVRRWVGRFGQAGVAIAVVVSLVAVAAIGGWATAPCEDPADPSCHRPKLLFEFPSFWILLGWLHPEAVPQPLPEDHVDPAANARFDHFGPGLRRQILRDFRACERRKHDENRHAPVLKAHLTITEECTAEVATSHDLRPWHVDRIFWENSGRDDDA